MEVFVMTFVIVPRNLKDILRNPDTPPVIEQNQAQTENSDTLIIILGKKCFLHLLAYERRHITIHAPDDIHTYPIADANRLAEYLVHICYLPEDTYTLDFITSDVNPRDEQHAKCFLQTLAHHLHQQLHHDNTRITYCGQPIKFSRSTQHQSGVFGFFARTINRYGEPKRQFVNASSEPDDTADQTQTRSSPNPPKPH
jgi:hypothetical protein